MNRILSAALSAALLLSLLAAPGCKSPQEKAADDMDKAMRENTKMMKRMQKTMEEQQRELEKND